MPQPRRVTICSRPWVICSTNVLEELSPDELGALPNSVWALLDYIFDKADVGDA